MENHDNIPDYLLAYLHGEASCEEQLLVAEWLKDDENAATFRQMKKIDSLTSDLSLLHQFDLEKGKAQVIVVSSDCVDESIKEVKGMAFIKYPGVSVDLGVACGKPFSISALAVLEPGDSDIISFGSMNE